MIQDGANRTPPANGATAAIPRRVGEPFNPWRMACGFYPPDVVARQRDLTDGQKRLYERAVRWAGQNGVFWRGFDSMAEALGKSVRQVKTDMAALEAMGLIRHRRRSRNTNIYEFLCHAMFEVQPTARQENLEVKDSPLEVQDDIALEVQSTARKSSQLESSPLNSVKADNQRIPGHASQRQRSAASSPVMEPPDAKNEPLEADRQSSSFSDTNPPRVENAAKGWTQEQLAGVRRRIAAFWGREPDEGFEVSVMLRARGAGAAAVCELLDRKFANKNCRPGGRWAPKNQNWFLTVVESEFTPGHLPEAPASVAGEQQIEAETLARGIEAIELAHAPRSIVESVICSDCGGAALVRYTDGSVEGCTCRNKAAGDLRRIAASSAPGRNLSVARFRTACE